jgi:RNA polymerase sigma-70 factor, ECF subfamily
MRMGTGTSGPRDASNRVAMPSRGTAALNNDEPEIIARVARGDQHAFETLMRRHNSKLFRVARAILKHDADAEEALQDAYLDAYRHIKDFEGAARLDTWLTRIVINQALMRLRKRRRDRVVVPFVDARDDASQPEPAIPDRHAESATDRVLRGEIRQLLERQIDQLPDTFRVVFVMREVQEMSTEEIADVLGIPVATVRTRLFRARTLLRAAIAREVDVATLDVFRFDGERCDRIVQQVLVRLS